MLGVMADNSSRGESALRKASPVKMLVDHDLRFIYYTVIHRVPGRMCVVDKDNNFNLLAFIIPLVRFPGMSQALDAYEGTTDLDFEVVRHFKEDPIPRIEDQEIKEMGEEVLRFASEALTTMGVDFKMKSLIYESESDALAFLYLYSMIKTGTADKFRAAVERRLNALAPALRLRNLNIQKFMEERYDFDTCRAIYTNMGLFPLLKGYIFSTVLTGDNPFSAHLRVILRGAQLRDFMFIYRFINAEKTELHTVQEIQGEIQPYLDTIAQLVRLYGDNWNYCKLVNPLDSIADAAKFPNLSKAGRAYAIVTGHAKVNEFKLSQVPRQYVTWAGTPLPLRKGDVNIDKIREGLKLIRPQMDFSGLSEDTIVEASNRAATAAIPDFVLKALQKPVSGLHKHGYLNKNHKQ